MLARPDRRMPHERELLAVRRVVSRISPVHRQRLLDPAVDRHLEQGGHRGECAPAAHRREDDLLSVRRPADGRVRRAVEGQLAGLAARGRDDVDVIVASAVRRKGDPAAVRREPRVHLAGAVVGEPVDGAAVLVRRPDVAEIAERDPAGVIVGMAREADRLCD